MKKQEEFSFDQLAQDPKEHSQNSVEDSQYLSKYNQFFSHLASKCEQICISSAANLHKYGIKYTPDSSYQPFKVSIQSSSKNSEIVILSIVWGHFSQKISIINFLHENNRTNRPNQINYNANTTLYEKIVHGKSVMIKSQILRSIYRTSIILSAIKELFIAKIGSALGFGPYCHIDTFFDLFIYDNCIEFGMEKCFGFQDEPFLAQNQEELKQCLLTMHFFKTIHFDIKPGNIMFSKHFKKFVLIDFNLSDVSNYQLGKKSQMPFRGTINFCSPEMVHNFLASTHQVKKVDPYYNDLFCLLQSIKLINVEKRRIMSPDQLEYLCDIIEEDEQENAILFIKKMMYQEEWVKVQQFFSQSIFNQKFYKILIEFLYELDLTENLQIFYNTFIPSALKETFFTRQFQYLLRKKWMVNLDNNSMKSEKKVQYTSRLDFTFVDHEKTMIQFNKAQTEQYLNNYEKFIASKVLYFSIFLQYASLSSNKFGVDQHDRKITAKICISFIEQKQDDLREAIDQGLLGEQQNNQSLIRAIVMIMQKVFEISHQSPNNDRPLVNSIIFQILPLIIILDIGTLQQNLQWYEQMLATLRDDQDKLCLLLSIKHLNEWNKNRIGKKGVHSRYVVCQKTKQFATLGLLNFNPNCSKQLRQIKQFALRQSLATDTSLHLNYEGIHLNLKKLVKNEQFQRYLQICSLDNKSIQKICKLTQTHIINGHLSFQPFYFSLYQRNKYIGELEFCSNIIKIYQQNLKDKYLESKFTIYYKNMSGSGLSKLFLATEVDKIEVYLNQIEDEDIGLETGLVQRVSNLGEVLKHNRQELTFQEYYSYFQSQEKIQGKLRSLLDKYYRYKVQKKDMKVHECFNPKYQTNLYIYDIQRFQTIEQCQAFLMNLKLMDQYTNCCRCSFAIDCFIVVCQQTWVVTNYPLNSIQIFVKLEEQLHQLNARILSGHQSNLSYLYFKQVMSHTILNYAVFCTFDKEHEIQHKGIRILYHTIKEEIRTSNANLVWIYLGKQQASKVILQNTMRILYEYEFDQLISLLLLLSRHLDRNLAMNNFNMVLICFTKFLLSINPKHQLIIEQCLRKQIELHPEIKNHLTIYFYCLAMTIQNTALQQRLYFRIAPTLAKLPLDLQAFYSSAIYLHFAKKLRSQEDKSQRRQLYINNKLVKLILRKWESKIEKGKKYPACKNIYMKLLVNKLKRIEGPISTIMDTSWKYVYSMKHIH